MALNASIPPMDICGLGFDPAKPHGDCPDCGKHMECERGPSGIEWVVADHPVPGSDILCHGSGQLAIKPVNPGYN